MEILLIISDCIDEGGMKQITTVHPLFNCRGALYTEWTFDAAVIMAQIKTYNKNLVLFFVL